MLNPPVGIKVETSPSFDRKWYRSQTALQFLLAIIILAGLAGLFGDGWLSSQVIRIGSAEVTYDRFARKTVPFRIVIRSMKDQAPGPIEVTIGRELTEKIAMIHTVPAAVASSETVDGTKYTFLSQNSRPEFTISVQPDHFGFFTWKLKIEGAGEASLFQIIYP